MKPTMNLVSPLFALWALICLAVSALVLWGGWTLLMALVAYLNRH